MANNDGESVYFEVDNTGNVSIRININNDDKNALTLAPNESGEISATIGSLSSNYKFKVVPTPNGGDISIDYHIYQK